MPVAVPRIQERAVQPLMSIPFARMESQETPRGAAPRIRPFGFTRAPQTEFLSFSDVPETVSTEQLRPAVLRAVSESTQKVRAPNDDHWSVPAAWHMRVRGCLCLLR